MAWFQNLAGRAEDLLNKIDQNAATVLNDNSNNINKLTDKEDSLINLGSIETFDENLVEFVQNENVNMNNLKSSENEFIKLDQDFGINIIEPEKQTYIYEDMCEKSPKNESPCGKSLSSHSSFILSEDIESYNEKISKLEYEVQDLNKQLLDLQHLCAELRNENAILQSQIETSNFLVETAQSEMEQYKARAQRILQEKEHMILLNNQNESSEKSDDILLNYNNELKKELEFQQNKNIELSEKVQKLTQDVSFLQQQIVLTQNASQQSNQALEENLTTEKKIRMIAEEECRLKNQELQLKIQELSQQDSMIHLKNEEINKLQEALKKRANVDANIDYEMQIKSLTEMLMVKQNTLETVTTERNALKLQLEKLENEYHNNLVRLERAQVRVINVNDTDDVKSQVPQFMRVSPFDAGVTRRVKTAYSTVDAISVRTGVFLRRYPLARVFVFCYMILLHFWVLIILFLYIPNSR